MSDETLPPITSPSDPNSTVAPPQPNSVPVANDYAPLTEIVHDTPATHSRSWILPVIVVFTLLAVGTIIFFLTKTSY